MRRAVRVAFIALIVGAPVLLAAEQNTDPFAAVRDEYQSQTRSLLKRFCLECHSTETQEGELDLERFTEISEVRRSVKTWLKVAEMLDNGEMPPKDAEQPSSEQRKQLRAWIERYLHAEAVAGAGDPGPVVLRRLNNAQYTYTLRDLTGVDLQPAREFPADSAAGEGFSNTGAALAMSPALLTKYFDAGKEIARHAVLLPDGFRFSPATTRRDWTDEILAQIRQTYRRYTDLAGGTEVDVQGLHWETNKGGRIPLEKYLDATLIERQALSTGAKSLEAVAGERGLNAKYLASLWKVLNDKEPSQLLDAVRSRWRSAQPGGTAAMVEEITRWQETLTTFQNVGHMKQWMTPAAPLGPAQEFRWKVPAPTTGNEVTLYLTAGEAGDGPLNDCVIWQQPRLVIPGRSDILLRDVREFTRNQISRRGRVFAQAAQALAAAEEASQAVHAVDVEQLAQRHGVDADVLQAWLDFLGVASAAGPKLNYLSNRIEQMAGYAFVRGWGTQDLPNLVANSSDQHVRIPGNMKPHGVTVHPSPTLNAAVGWQCPVAGAIRIAGQVTHAHPECGNGVTWALELRRGRVRQALASGTVVGAKTVEIGPIEQLAVQPGDFITLLIGPRDASHACDLTDLELVLTNANNKDQAWSLTRDVADDVLAGNPHADRLGNGRVWHFFSEPVNDTGAGPAIPSGSLLAQWRTTTSAEEKQKLADGMQKLLTGGPPADAKHPDAVLYHQLASLGGPLFAGARAEPNARRPQSTDPPGNPAAAGDDWGLDPQWFGRHVDGASIEAASLCVQAPSVIKIRLPADLVVGSEFVASGVLDSRTGGEGSVQLSVGVENPPAPTELRAGIPVVVNDKSAARERFERAFADFRQWFPRAICYIQIVPVDEAVTLTLFHREDEPLCRLMLDDVQKARLDRLWEELHFASHDALTLVDAFAQLMEYATQDSDPKLFEPFRKPINDRAAAFRQALVDAEPRQLDALVDFAARAYRRSLTAAERNELRGLYRTLREEQLSHDEAFRFTLARLFVAPAFLYRLEAPPQGEKAAPLSDGELANRLSYFLWSSLPDAALRDAAEKQQLHDADALLAQTRRLLGDERVRRLAGEFACQWLHIYDFDALDEKSERHFPEFSKLRGDMYEEAIRFFTDLFQRDGSVLDILNADHTFVNGSLANFYGISGVSGDEWRRVDGLRKQGRGGILGLSATLAKQSGASRTSPILRGNWVAEVLLGEKLPRPPKDVPRLPEDEAAIEGLTVRQLVEKHTSDMRCAGCHAKIDPIGFTLEGFDAIGRQREKDLAGRPIDARTKLADGTELDGLAGLKEYLLTTRREAFLKQFCRKLLGYALGRGVQLSDEPLLDEMRRQLAAHDYRFSVAVETIVRSPQFREIRGKDGQLADAP